MVKRKRIAIIFELNNNWIGFSNYIINIINTLNFLPDDSKPNILIITRKEQDYQYLVEVTKYPYIEKNILLNKRNSRYHYIINCFYQKLFKKNFPWPAPYLKDKVDAILPIYKIDLIRSKSTKYYWIPDLQEKYYPSNFHPDEIKKRNKFINKLIEKKANVIISSHTVLKDLYKFYPHSYNLNIYIYRFASIIQSKININKKIILEKYGIIKPFFFCPNQFWCHKNHSILIQAVEILKRNGIEIILVCSGSIFDYRNKEYFSSLKNYIDSHGLENNIKILGLINRDEVLLLLKESIAVIQPSLFEGWSTSVEEAKAMNKFIILSDIEIHKEQINNNCLFFKKNSAEDLSDKIKLFLNSKISYNKNNYNTNIREALNQLICIIK